MATYCVTYFRTTTEEVSKVIEANTADEDELYRLALAAEEDERTQIKMQECECEPFEVEEVPQPKA